MGRPKGSKNKVKAIIFTGDINSAISDRIAEKESLSAETTTLSEQMKCLKTDFRTKNRRIKALEKEITKLTEMKAEKEAPKPLDIDDDAVVIEES